jgi:hypothetical protein
MKHTPKPNLNPYLHLNLRAFLVLWSTLFAVCVTAQETWRSELYPEEWDPEVTLSDVDFRTDEFIQDFSYAGYHRGERIIPWVQGPIFDVTDYDADASGASDSTLAIQAAINAAAAAGGGVVYLPAGEYRISRRPGESYALVIRSSNLVLRGAGTERTFIINTSYEMRQAQAILVAPSGGSNWTSSRSQPINITQDYTGPTKTIRIANTRGFEAGEWIAVQNRFTDQVSENGSFVEDVNMHLSSSNPNWLGQGQNLGGTIDYRMITVVDEENNTLTLDAPTRWFLLQRDNARVYYVDPHLEEVGLEGFSIGNLRHSSTGNFADSAYNTTSSPAYDVHGSYLINLTRVANSWVRDVHSFNPGNNNTIHMLSNGLVLDWSRAVTLERVHMQRTQYGGGGGNGYMIRLNSVNEILVQDCLVAYCRHGFVMWRMQNSGNVIRNSYDGVTGVQFSNAGNIQGTGGRGSDHHGLLSHSNLFERNTMDTSFLEAAFRGTSGGAIPHAQTSSQVLFWNQIGLSYHPSYPYIIHSQQAGRGYVIGTQGTAPNVRTTPRISGSGHFTDPVDRTEGIGESENLYPQSIYEDQVMKRFQREGLVLPPWQGADALGEGVYRLPNWGNVLFAAEHSYIYHFGSGWWYFVGRDYNSIYLYSFDRDAWFWSNRYILPHMWNVGEEEWQ